MWFSAVLVFLVTTSIAYSFFATERVHYGDIIDQAGAELHAQDAWAVTRSLGISCGGLFVIGVLILGASFLGGSNKD